MKKVRSAGANGVRSSHCQTQSNLWKHDCSEISWSAPFLWCDQVYNSISLYLLEKSYLRLVYKNRLQRWIPLFFQIRWLRVEQRISDLDREIKASVHYQKPDMETCLKQLEELQTLAVTPFMFKKQPAIVQTMRMLTKYCGPAATSRDLQVLVVSGINSPPHPVPLFSQRQCSAFLIVIVYHSNPIVSVWLPQPRSLVRQAKILIIFDVDFYHILAEFSS